MKLNQNKLYKMLPLTQEKPFKFKIFKTVKVNCVGSLKWKINYYCLKILYDLGQLDLAVKKNKKKWVGKRGHNHFQW